MPRRAPVTFKRFTGRTLLKPFVPARLLKASGMKFLKDRHRRQGHASSPGLLAACGTGLASGSLYEVANVSVDTTAKDPVVARALVLAKAGQKALRVVLKRLVPGSAQAMLPAITGCRGHDQQPLGAQRAELDHYLATFDVSFNEIAVKEFLDRRGVPFSEARAAQISILPLVLDRAGLKSKGAEGWRQAWEGLDLSHSIAPTNILRPRQPRRRDGVEFSGLKHWQEIRGRVGPGGRRPGNGSHSLSERAASITSISPAPSIAFRRSSTRTALRSRIEMALSC
jgi:hypothetical protein